MVSHEQPSPKRWVYRWPRGRLVRPLGVLVIGIGLLWVVVTLVAAFTDGADRTLVLVAAVASLLGLGMGGLLFAFPPRVLELTDDGYRLHHLRGGGTPSAGWPDITAVSTGESTAGPVLVLEGRTQPASVVPLALLGPRAGEALERVRSLLDGRNGDRRP